MLCKRMVAFLLMSGLIYFRDNQLTESELERKSKEVEIENASMMPKEISQHLEQLDMVKLIESLCQLILEKADTNNAKVLQLTARKGAMSRDIFT